MLSVLNARDDWHGDALTSQQTRRTQVTFTEQFPSLIEGPNSRAILPRSRTDTEQTGDFGSRDQESREDGDWREVRETQSGLKERKNQRRSEEGSEVQTSEYGIQSEYSNTDRTSEGRLRD